MSSFSFFHVFTVPALPSLGKVTGNSEGEKVLKVPFPKETGFSCRAWCLETFLSL